MRIKEKRIEKGIEIDIWWSATSVFCFSCVCVCLYTHWRWSGALFLWNIENTSKNLLNFNLFHTRLLGLSFPKIVSECCNYDGFIYFQQFITSYIMKWKAFIFFYMYIYIFLSAFKGSREWRKNESEERRGEGLRLVESPWIETQSLDNNNRCEWFRSISNDILLAESLHVRRCHIHAIQISHRMVGNSAVSLFLTNLRSSYVFK